VVVVYNDRNQILLQQRTSPYGVWGLPGGLMELGESLEDTARREAYEETGLKIGRMIMMGMFSGADYFVTVPNGDQFYVVTAAFASNEVEGAILADSNESLRCEYVSWTSLPTEMVRSHRHITMRFIQTYGSQTGGLLF
jgi:8-oxo-dGTP pyrophosphatase MutT (NUDIX family)